MSILGSASKAIPGSLCRFGPAKVNGEARVDHTGSTRILSPAVWISQLAWLMNDNRTFSPLTLGGGVSAWGLGAHSGQVLRSRPEPNCHFNTWLSDFGGTPSGSKKRSPSK